MIGKMDGGKALTTTGKLAVTAIIVAVVAGAVGYFAGTSLVPGVGPAETVTKTVTVTQTETAPTVTPTEKITVTILIGSGSHFAPASKFKDQYEAENPHIELVFVESPHVELRDKALIELKAGARESSYDAFEYVYTWLGDFADPGYLQPIDAWIAASPEAKALFDDYQPEIKFTYTNWAGSTYGIIYDGDQHNYYYRKDLFTDPTIRSQFKDMYGYDLPTPEGEEYITMDQYIDIGNFFMETKAGGVQYGGSDLAKRGRMYLWWADRLAGYGGSWFDDDGNPAINNQAGIDALEHWLKCMDFNPPGVLEYEYAEHENEWVTGNVPQYVQWPDAFLEVLNPGAVMYRDTDKIGMAVCPGGAGVYATGWCFAFPGNAKHAKEAFDFLVWLTSPPQSIWSVTHSESGCQAYAVKAHFENPDIEFVEGIDYRPYWKGLQAAAAVGMIDMRIPHASAYLDVLDEQLSRALAGEIDAKTALDETADTWVDLNERFFGQSTLPKEYVEFLKKPPS